MLTSKLSIIIDNVLKIFICTKRESVNLVKFLNDDVLISGDDNGLIKVWDLKSSKCVYEGGE